MAEAHSDTHSVEGKLVHVGACWCISQAAEELVTKAKSEVLDVTGSFCGL